MKKIKLYSYYFPNWHQDDRNDNWHGKGWTEWEVLKCARARFVGHKQPLIPTWGYEDESKPEVMEKKIGFIGGGATAEAILSGAVSKQVFAAENIFVSDH